jgi:hypothetical protein
LCSTRKHLKFDPFYQPVNPMDRVNPNPRRVLLMQTLLVIVVCVVVFIWLWGIGAFKGPSKEHSITFRVQATGGVALVTYSDAVASTKNAILVTAPWSRTATNPSGTEIYLTAGNPSQSGTVECKLLIDGREWKSDKASYPDDSVACAGIVP